MESKQWSLKMTVRLNFVCLIVSSVFCVGVLEAASCEVEDLEVTTISTGGAPCLEQPSIPDLSLLWNTDWVKSILPHIRDSNCRSQLQETLTGLSNMEMWAIQMADSTGRIPSHLLSGNSHQLGNYDQCLSSGHSPIQPQYCLGLVDVTAARTAPQGVKHVVNSIRGNDFIVSHREQSSHFVPTYTTVKWGLCLPASCSPTALSQAFNLFFNQTLPPYMTVQTAIQERFCKRGHVKDARLLQEDAANSGWPLTTYLGMLLLAGLAVTSLLSTYLDQHTVDVPLSKMSKSEGLLVACSLKRSWIQFFETKKEDIGCIHGLRTVASLLLFIAHNVIPVCSIPFVNRTDMTEITFQPFSSLFRSSIVYTNTFLFLSGLLSSYYLQSTSSILTRFSNRLLRMMPLLLVVIVFSGYILPFLGSGPLWSYIVGTNADLCVENGWRNLLFIQNFFPFERMCAPHTHHLALDMQLFILTIPLVMGLKSHPIITSIVMLVWTLGSAGLRYWTAFYHRISVVIYTGVSVQDLYRAADLSYINPIHRSSSYLSGLWLGFLLYKIKFHPVKLSKGNLYAGWCMAGLCLSYCLMANYQAGASDYRYDVKEAANYAALEPLATSLALSWIILVCSTGYGGLLNSFLSSRVMCLLSKMSFSIYLVQFCVFFYSLGTIRTSKTFSIWNMAALPELCLVILSSFVLTLAVDIPAQNLKSLLFR